MYVLNLTYSGQQFSVGLELGMARFPSRFHSMVRTHLAPVGLNLITLKKEKGKKEALVNRQ